MLSLRLLLSSAWCRCSCCLRDHYASCIQLGCLCCRTQETCRSASLGCRPRESRRRCSLTLPGDRWLGTWCPWEDKGLTERRDESCRLRVALDSSCCMRTLQEHVAWRQTLGCRHEHREIRPKELVLWVRVDDRRPCLLIHIQVLSIDIVILSNVIASIGIKCRHVHGEHVHHTLQSLWIRNSFLLII